MTKAELESKHLAELHALAAEADVPRYRMLRREELIERLLGGEPEEKPKSRERQEPRRRRRRGRDGAASERAERPERRERSERREQPKAEAPPKREESAKTPAAETRRPRRRRRRRFGRRRKALRLRDLLAPRTPGRQTIAYAETREACTDVLRELAGELAASGVDPVVLLVDPGPEELAEWRREAPRAEIVAAAQAHHAEDALAQAASRAEGGEDVIVLIDSLTRFGEAFGDAGAARDLLDAERGPAGSRSGSLTVVAALERR